MELKIKLLNEKAVLPKIAANGNSFELICVGIATGQGRDGRLILEYKTGLEIEIPQGFVGVIHPADNAYGFSLAMTNSIVVMHAGAPKEIVAHFKTNTDSIPAVYEAGEVFATMTILELPAVSIVEIAPDYPTEITEEITSDIKVDAEPDSN